MNFTRISDAIAKAAGRPSAFLTALALVLIWAATGPSFHYSENWQLVINTSTTIITFLMVFLIQSSQNRDGAALQAKLDALILASEAQNKFVAIEQLTAEEIEALRAGIVKTAGDPELTIAPSVTEKKPLI